MNLLEKLLNEKGFKLEKTIATMTANNELKADNYVLVAGNGNIYKIGSVGAIALQNGLKATLVISDVAKEISSVLTKLDNHIPVLASTTQNGHMSKDDKKLVDTIPNKFNKTGETVLNLNGYNITVV